MSLEVFSPIPLLDAERELKPGYMDHPIDPSNPLFVEPLVPIADYGVDGINYYSQPNSVTGDAIEGMTPHVFVRKTVAEKLASANDFLIANDEAARVFDTRIQLYVRDGFRPPQLQAYLHDTYFPQLLKSQNPDWTEDQIVTKRNEVIAKPKQEDGAVSPHATGGAVDLILVSADDGSIINTGFRHATLGETSIYTDYLETIDVAVEGLVLALQARRVLHNTLLSPEIGGVAMVNNPVETWHYSYGDQMWGLLGRHSSAFYGYPPEVPPELIF